MRSKPCLGSSNVDLIADGPFLPLKVNRQPFCFFFVVVVVVVFVCSSVRDNILSKRSESPICDLSPP